ncbi:hypothetical protein QQS21_009479 [Conoideocrella luteorostrata]|uniref:Uncharacterized protein n=1 Tax=Conoideocrella luteorostrata TaxID=1105319 RepID=A0AAJ0FQ96_9HYPO|nr:hypothetical protein QQS21_009479 [Conoideocrella luteorostrata]
MSSVPTLPPSAKRPHTENNAAILPSAKKLKTEEYGIACSSPSSNAGIEANLGNEGASDEMMDENMGDEEEEDSGEERYYRTCDETEWGSNSQMSFSSDSTDEARTPPFDKEYIHPEDCLGTSARVCQEEEEQELDDQDTYNLVKYERKVRARRRRLLKQLNATASVQGLEEKMEDLNLTRANGKTTVSQKEEIYETDSDSSDSDSSDSDSSDSESSDPDSSDPDSSDLDSSDSDSSDSDSSDSDSSDSDSSDLDSDSKDWSKPDAVRGWESAADGSRLLPEAIELVLEFFQDRPYLNRAECEEYCLKAYLNLNLRKGDSPYQAQERPLSLHAYPSESQFRNSYMVEILDTTVTNPARMTQFYITPEKLDQLRHLETILIYGEFVPKYVYFDRMGLAPKHSEELFVWCIESPAGRPFAADCHRLGLRVNHGKYIGILKHFVDLVYEPLTLHTRGVGGSDGVSGRQAWPMVPHNPRLDEYNIIIRPDWSGIACVLLWEVPPVMSLPFGASLSGLLRLEGYPLPDVGVDGNPLRRANPSLFLTYNREGRELERLCMYYLREKISFLADDDPLSWHRLFEAMNQGFATAVDLDELDRLCYARQVNELKWDWFRFEIKADDVPDERPVAYCAESESGEENGDPDADMNID